MSRDCEEFQARCYQDKSLDSQEWGTTYQGSARRKLWQNNLGYPRRVIHRGKMMTLEKEQEWMIRWPFWVPVPVTSYLAHSQT